ncbi:SDR family NAD(P)-dependent oxidoreductase [Mucilaginibacter sp.]
MSAKKILITGASRGLGLALAQKLAADYQLILHASAQTSFTTVPPGSQLLCADFTDAEQIAAFCRGLKKEHGDDLYAVINNAGMAYDKSLIYQPEQEIDAMLSVNLKAPVMICKTAMKIFSLKHKGVIINISSVVGETGNAFQSVYAAAKAGLVALSKSLAQEAAALNQGGSIRVLSVSPGLIETDMTKDLPEAEKDRYINMIPSRRLGTVNDIAETVAFLLSDKAAYINGSNIQVNGGLR